MSDDGKKRPLSPRAYLEVGGGEEGRSPIRPKEPAVLETADADSIAAWLDRHASEDANAVADVRVAWGSYVRSVARLQPSPRFEEVLAECGFVLTGRVVRGLGL